VATSPPAGAPDRPDLTDIRAGHGSPGWVGLAVAVGAWVAVAARVFTEIDDLSLRPWYAGGLAAFLVIALVVLLRRGLPAALLHVAFGLQAALVLGLLGLDPKQDFVVLLFVVQCYQAAIVFTARPRVVWVITLVSLMGISLVLLQDKFLNGLAYALSYMAAGVVFATFVVVGQELESAREASQRMVADLQAAQRQLEVYAGQVDEIAAIEQRARLARDLDESVSLTLSEVVAAARAAEELLDDADAAAAELERLQTLTHQALAQMREVIAELRPRPAEAVADG
jgi:signal transduction histidine kinase